MTDDVYRRYGRHVVKFADGMYLSTKLTYESRVLRQQDAQRYISWASAKAIADSTSLAGKGARAFRLSPVVWLSVSVDGEVTLLGNRTKMRELWKPGTHPGCRLVRYVVRYRRRL
jgi:hypothetical protein